jgi:hypothetical protein
LHERREEYVAEILKHAFRITSGAGRVHVCVIVSRPILAAEADTPQGWGEQIDAAYGQTARKLAWPLV